MNSKDILNMTFSDEQNEKFEKISKELKSKYPNGYSVIAAFGKTRTMYSFLKLMKIQESELEIPDDFDPGKLEDIKDYADTIHYLYTKHFTILKRLGVTDIILTMLHYEAWHSRGDEYIKAMIHHLPLIIDENMQKFFETGFTPYFIGLDILLNLYESGSKEHSVGLRLKEFQDNFVHKEGNVYLGLELFPVNSYTNSMDLLEMSEDERMNLKNEISKIKDPVELEEYFYTLRITKLCNGHYVPRDSCYIGSCYSGDFHIRSTFDSEIIHTKRQRLFYYPAPSLMMTTDSYINLFEDIVVDKKAKMRSGKFDHSGLKDLSYWKKELQSSIDITTNTESVLGLLK